MKDESGVVTTYEQAMRPPLGFSVSANYRITALERPHNLTATGTSGGPIHPSVTYELVENATGGTSVRCPIDFQPTGAARLAAPLASFLRH